VERWSGERRIIPIETSFGITCICTGREIWSICCELCLSGEQVLPKHNEISCDSETRYVRIMGTQEAVFRVSQLIHFV